MCRCLNLISDDQDEAEDADGDDDDQVDHGVDGDSVVAFLTDLASSRQTRVIVSENRKLKPLHYQGG